MPRPRTIAPPIPSRRSTRGCDERAREEPRGAKGERQPHEARRETHLADYVEHEHRDRDRFDQIEDGARDRDRALHRVNERDAQTLDDPPEQVSRVLLVDVFRDPRPHAGEEHHGHHKRDRVEHEHERRSEQTHEDPAETGTGDAAR